MLSPSTDRSELLVVDTADEDEEEAAGLHNEAAEEETGDNSQANE